MLLKQYAQAHSRNRLAKLEEAATKSSDPSEKTICFKEYREFWIAYSQFWLICKLNGVSLKEVDSRAKDAEPILINYFKALTDLGVYLDEQGKQIMLETAKMAALPEFPI